MTQETEFNDIPFAANTLVPGQAMQASISTVNDVDYFGFHINAPSLAYLRFDGPNDEYWRGYRVEVEDATGLRLAGFQIFTTLETHIVPVWAAGDYFVRIASFGLEDYWPSGIYSLTLSRAVIDISHHESEPNNSLANADPLTLGVASIGQLSSADDQDWYTFTVNSPGLLGLSIGLPTGYFYDGGGVAGRLETPDGVVLTTLRGDEELQMGLAAGTYVVRIQGASYSQGFVTYSDKPYEITYSFEAGLDAGFEVESNNSANTANTLQLNQSVQGGISNSSDSDWYRIELDQAGLLEVGFAPVEFGSSYEPYGFELVDANGQTLAGIGMGYDVVSYTTPVVQPGEYYLRVFSFLSGDYWQGSYTLSANLVPGPVEGYEAEQNNSRDLANELVLGQTVVGQLSSATDLDYFAFTTSGVGTFVYTFAPDYAPNRAYFNFRIEDALGNVLTEPYILDSGYPVVVSVPAAGTYYAVVGVPYFLTNSQYSLTAEFEASTATAFEMEGNDTALQANPLVLGEETAGQAWGEDDYFSVTLDTTGVLSLTLDGPPSGITNFRNVLGLELSDSNGQVVAGFRNLNYPQTVEVGIFEAGTYYARVGIVFLDGMYVTDGRYSLTAGFTAGSPTAFESEGNESLATAGALSFGNTLTAQLRSPTDSDVFRVDAASAGHIKLTIDRFADDRVGTIFFALTDENNYIVARSYPPAGTSELTFHVTHAGTFYLYIHASNSYTWFGEPYHLTAHFSADAVETQGVDGDAGNNTISASDSDDVVRGGAGTDALDGRWGNDLLDGGAGNDTLVGGLGDDTFVVDSTQDQVVELAYEGFDTIQTNLSTFDLLFYFNIEAVEYTGTESFTGIGNPFYDDEITGGSGDDSLVGNGGNDTLIGGAGDDILEGGAGNDVLHGGSGFDLLLGGEGNDIYYIDSDTFFLFDSDGSDTVMVSADYVKLPGSIEAVNYVNGAKALPYWISALLSDDAAGKFYTLLLDGATTMGYAFPDALPAYDESADDAFQFSAFNEAQRAFALESLSYISTVVGLTFGEVADPAADNVLSFANNSQPTSAAYAYYPSLDFVGSDVFLDNTTPGNLAPIDGEYAALTFIHEIGHALGLEHPFFGGSDAPHLVGSEESTLWTVMSYNSDPAQYHLAFSPLDIAALHYLYGPSQTARTGNNTYLIDATGANFIWDGAGTDTLSASGITQNVTLYLSPGEWGYVGAKAATITAAGQVTVNFGSSIENLIGGTGHDDLYGSAGNNTLNGGAGDDTLWGGLGNDSLIGGSSGIDTASYSHAIAGVVASLTGVGSATGGAGTDTLSGIENLIGSDYNDSLTGSSAANRLEGGAGNDTLNGSSGTDTLLGGLGDDQYVVDTALDIITELAGEGIDGITTALLSFNLAIQTDQVENLRFTAAAGSVVNGIGNTLNNVLTASNGNDNLDGASGNDTAAYTYASAAVVASLTSRTASGGSGTDTLLNFENLQGSNYADTLIGNTLANRLDGAGGADTLNGGAGADTMTGGSGSDQFTVDNLGDVVVELGSDALSGTDWVLASISHTLSNNVENLRLTGVGHTTATGNSGNNVLVGNAGDNILNGLAGADTASYAYATGAVNVSLRLSGAAQVTGSAGSDTLLFIENLTGSNYNDTLQGDAYDNMIDGGIGTDTLDFGHTLGGVTANLKTKIAAGANGNDQILRIENLLGSGFADNFDGSSGANLLRGFYGSDTLRGWAGADTLDGGGDADILYGGLGADTFVYTDVFDSLQFSFDQITDFRATQGDKIDLSAIDADTTQIGNQAFVFIGGNAFTGAGQVRYDAAAGMLYASTDADAAAEMAIQLVGSPTISGINFFV